MDHHYKALNLKFVDVHDKSMLKIQFVYFFTWRVLLCLFVGRRYYGSDNA